MSKRIERERHWRDVVAQFERSGQTVRSFCVQAGIGENQFYCWRRKFRILDGKLSPTTAPASPTGGSGVYPEVSAFTPVRVVDSLPDSPPAIEIIIGNGKRVAVQPGFDADVLARVIQVVEAGAC